MGFASSLSFAFTLPTQKEQIRLNATRLSSRRVLVLCSGHGRSTCSCKLFISRGTNDSMQGMDKGAAEPPLVNKRRKSNVKPWLVQSKLQGSVNRWPAPSRSCGIFFREAQLRILEILPNSLILSSCLAACNNGNQHLGPAESVFLFSPTHSLASTHAFLRISLWVVASLA